MRLSRAAATFVVAVTATAVLAVPGTASAHSQPPPPNIIAYSESGAPTIKVFWRTDPKAASYEVMLHQVLDSNDRRPGSFTHQGVRLAEVRTIRGIRPHSTGSSQSTRFPKVKEHQAFIASASVRYPDGKVRLIGRDFAISDGNEKRRYLKCALPLTTAETVQAWSKASLYAIGSFPGVGTAGRHAVAKGSAYLDVVDVVVDPNKAGGFAMKIAINEKTKDGTTKPRRVTQRALGIYEAVAIVQDARAINRRVNKTCD